MRLETYKMATSILLKFQTLKCDILRTIWRIKVSDGLLFCIFHALSFERNLFFDRTCPLIDTGQSFIDVFDNKLSQGARRPVPLSSDHYHDVNKHDTSLMNSLKSHFTVRTALGHGEPRRG